VGVTSTTLWLIPWSSVGSRRDAPLSTASTTPIRKSCEYGFANGYSPRINARASLIDKRLVNPHTGI
jgi:hypothetical protein